MGTVALAGQAPVAINLNQPGSYVTWNIFTISVANLVLIAVMVAIFGAALLLPFPGRRHVVPADPGADASSAAAEDQVPSAVVAAVDATPNT